MLFVQRIEKHIKNVSISVLHLNNNLPYPETLGIWHIMYYSIKRPRYSHYLRGNI